MARMAGYVRKSDREKGGEEPLETQRAVVSEWCAREGHELIGFYEDPNCRNTVPVDQRVGGAWLLRDAARGKFDAVVVYRLDRWARKGTIAHAAFAQLTTHDIGFCSATEPINQLTPESRMMRSVLLALAEWERDTIELRCTDGRLRRAKAGLYCGGVIPYGFTVTDGRLAPDPEEAAIVVRIYRWLVEDRLGTQRIATRLNEMGVPAAARAGAARCRANHPDGTAGIWRPQQVRFLLKNAVYCGQGLYGKTVQGVGRRGKSAAGAAILQQGSALVSAALWQAAQHQLAANRALSPRNARYEWLLRGKVKCALCGHTYVGVLGAPKKGQPERVRYYACLGRTHSGKAFGDGRRCPAPYVPAAVLETDLWQEIETRLAHPPATLAQLAATWVTQDQERENTAETLDALQRALAQKEQARRNTVDLLADGVITREDARDKLERLQEERRAIESRVSELADALDQQRERQVRLGRAKSFLEAIGATLAAPLPFAERQQLVHLLVERIEIRAEAGEIIARYTLCFAPTEDRVAGQTNPSWSISTQEVIRAAA